jgi:hypothetical protein
VYRVLDKILEQDYYDITDKKNNLSPVLDYYTFFFLQIYGVELFVKLLDFLLLGVQRMELDMFESIFFFQQRL